nr:immunoglobulin heavy chain junction region [Macaca mulatta]
CAKKEDSLDVC